MPAISNQGFAGGFMQGYEFVDENIRQHKRDQMAIEDRGYQREQTALQNERIDRQEQRQIEAIDTSNQRYTEEQAYRRERDTQTDKRLDKQDQRMDSADRRAWNVERRSQMLLARQEQDRRRQMIHAQALRYWQSDPFSMPQELRDQIDKEPGMEDLNPLNPRFGVAGPAAGRIMQSVGSGNLNYVNSPQGLADANEVYAGQIKTGIGEFVAPMGGSIVDKKLVKFHAAPGGKFATEVEVTLDNGKKYSAPLTINRTTDQGDPVQLTDVSIVLDDLHGRYQLSQLAKDPEFQRRRQTVLGASGVAGVRYGDMSSTGKTIRDLMSFGVPQDEAIARATNAKVNPQKEAADVATAMVKNQDPYSEAKITWEEAYNQVLPVMMRAAQPDQSTAIPTVSPQSTATTPSSATAATPAPAQSTATPPAAAAPTAQPKGAGQFQEGQTATNKTTGEKMIYKDGAWHKL